MDGSSVVGLIEELDWVEPVADNISGGVEKALETTGPLAQPIRNFLHGTWLGHPLHPLLTDIPIGAWTITTALDVAEVFGVESAGVGADIAVSVGLAGALGSAVSGLADWSVLEEDSRPRKIGTVHAILNISATALYVGSLILRRRKKRGAARVLAAAGYALVGISAYLGGMLVFDEKIGVNHAPAEGYPQDWVAVLPENALIENKPVAAKTGNIDLVLVKQGGEIYALANSCSHQGGPLCDGKVVGKGIVCPWHQSRFNLETGAVIDGPAAIKQPSLQVQIRNGQVEVKSVNYD